LFFAIGQGRGGPLHFNHAGLSGMKLSTTRASWFFSSRNFKVFQAVLISAMILTWIVYRYAERFNYNLSGFICIGDKFMPPSGVPRGTIVYFRSAGYDGQFYYRMALNPLADKEELQYFDSPVYRYQRIGYPLLAALFSLGNKSWLPASLLITNMLVMVLSVFTISIWLKEKKLDPRYAVMYALSGTLVYPLMRDLSEPTSAAFLIIGFFFYTRHRFLSAGLFFGYAILCREVVFAVLPVLVLDWLFLQKAKRAWIAPLVSFLIMVGWHLFVFVHLEASSYPFRGRVSPANLLMPGVSVFTHLRQVFVYSANVSVWLQIVLLTSVAVILISIGLAVKELVRSRNALGVCFLGFSFLPLTLSETVWVEPWAYCRMIVPSLALLFLCFIHSRSKWYLVPFGLHAVLFFASLKWLVII
jgi:hypothetical protein